MRAGQGWFLAVASFKAHLKLVFFDGASLTSVPPGPPCDQVPGEIPVGSHAAIPTTNRVLVLIRAIPPDGNNAAANTLMQTVKVYPLNRPADWKEPSWIRIKAGDLTPLQWETNLQLWQVLMKVIHAEPV